MGCYQRVDFERASNGFLHEHQYQYHYTTYTTYSSFVSRYFFCMFFVFINKMTQLPVKDQYSILYYRHPFDFTPVKICETPGLTFMSSSIQCPQSSPCTPGTRWHQWAGPSPSSARPLEVPSRPSSGRGRGAR